MFIIISYFKLSKLKKKDFLQIFGIYKNQFFNHTVTVLAKFLGLSGFKSFNLHT